MSNDHNNTAREDACFVLHHLVLYWCGRLTWGPSLLEPAAYLALHHLVLYLLDFPTCAPHPYKTNKQPQSDLG